MRFLTDRHHAFRDQRISLALSTALVFLLAGVLGACSSTGQRTANPEIPEDADSANGFLIVDCLLPGQVKKLGSKLTFLAPRRPLKTSGSDCEIRGGEYVAYDRADYSTALKIWLPLAQEGGAEAQTYVGEIYEKGLGLSPDFQLAAQWYQKAVEQGYSRAQINLGHLYEKGLGVESDKQKALNLYRNASGMRDDRLLFASTLSATHVPLKSHAAVQTQLTEQQQRNAELQRQLRRVDQALQTQTSVLLDAEKKLQKTEQQLEQLTSAQVNVDSTNSTAKETELAGQIDSLNAERQRLEQQLDKLDQQNQQLIQNQQSVEEQLSSTTQAESSYRTKVEATQKELADTQQQLLLTKAQLQVEKSKREQSLRRQDEKHAAALAQKQQQLVSLSAQFEQQVAQVNRQKHEISKLQQEASTYAADVSPAAGKPVLLAATNDAPRIEIIEPPVVLTRSRATVRLRALEQERQVIGKVSAPAGLMSLSVNGINTPLADNNLFRASVPIKGDPTPVDVVVIDGNGRRAAVTFSFINQTAESQTNIAQASTEGVHKTQRVSKVQRSDASGDYHALIIGNNDYEHVSTLATAVNDARETDLLLREKYNFKTRLLLNANRYEILSALNELNQTLKEKDNLLIYYAGHGRLDETNERGYWLPVDAEPDNNANWISNRAITDMLDALPAKHVLVVADSCYSGTLTQTPLARVETAVPADVRAEWIELMEQTRARITLTSGGLEPVLDGGGGEHSVFAKAFLGALRSNDGILEGYSLYYQVLDRMQQKVTSPQQSQVPQYAPIHMAGHESGEFLFYPG